MPKRGKLEKKSRDEAMLAGVRKHRDALRETPVGPDGLDVDLLVTQLEEHLATLADIERYDRLKSMAVAKERAQERVLRPLLYGTADYLRTRFGKESQALLDFGVKPWVEPKISAETKLVAVLKRRATRAKRRTMGPKQKKKIRGW